ncbi:hypothetical protein CDIK_1252 [Cucumispora dikerogammari]|nr:hypothetical protein CDIK_1252 [Cucumispora dikerogammari]
MLALIIETTFTLCQIKREIVFQTPIVHLSKSKPFDSHSPEPHETHFLTSDIPIGELEFSFSLDFFGYQQRDIEKIIIHARTYNIKTNSPELKVLFTANSIIAGIRNNGASTPRFDPIVCLDYIDEINFGGIPQLSYEFRLRSDVPFNITRKCCAKEEKINFIDYLKVNPIGKNIFKLFAYVTFKETPEIKNCSPCVTTEFLQFVHKGDEEGTVLMVIPSEQVEVLG